MIKKSELKNGDIVEVRDGNKYIVLFNSACWGSIQDLLINIKTGCFLDLRSYNNDLLYVYKDSSFDIMKVYSTEYVGDNIKYHIIENTDKWTSLREESKHILTKKEYRYLKNVIAPFRDRVKWVKKYSGSYKEFISLRYYDECDTDLAYFEKDTMYKGMEPNKVYTLKELGLDK